MSHFFDDASQAIDKVFHPSVLLQQICDDQIGSQLDLLIIRQWNEGRGRGNGFGEHDHEMSFLGKKLKEIGHRD
jgi:hypothetical protein